MTSAVLYENDKLLLTRLAFTHAPESGKRRGRHDYGYEVYFKQASSYAYVSGMEARALTKRIDVWRDHRPCEEEVVRTLDEFASASGLWPLTYH